MDLRVAPVVGVARARAGVPQPVSTAAQAPRHERERGRLSARPCDAKCRPHAAGCEGAPPWRWTAPRAPPADVQRGAFERGAFERGTFRRASSGGRIRRPRGSRGCVLVGEAIGDGQQHAAGEPRPRVLKRGQRRPHTPSRCSRSHGAPRSRRKRSRTRPSSARSAQAAARASLPSCGAPSGATRGPDTAAASVELVRISSARAASSSGVLSASAARDFTTTADPPTVAAARPPPFCRSPERRCSTVPRQDRSHAARRKRVPGLVRLRPQ